jgi:tetratricopeptide (TPR) repeat protein
MTLLAAVAVGASFVYLAAARERDYRRLLAQGEASLASGQIAAAIEDYSRAIAIRPDSMLARLRRGETYRRRGDMDQAARDFRAAALLDPTATRPLEQWGDALFHQQRFKRAAETYEARLRLDDRSALIHYKVGLSHYREGNLEAALQALNRAVRLDERLADAHYLMGICHKERREYDAALVALERAVLHAPGSIPIREELADVDASLGRRIEEIEQLQVLAGLDSGRIERRIAVAVAHHRAGHTDLAILSLNSLLERVPNPSLIYGALGRFWLEMAETRRERPDAIVKALEALERAASSLTATSEVKTLYGRALLHDRQFETAELVLQQATERFPVDPAAFAEYAAVAERQHHPAAARKALLSYSALVDDDAGFPSRALKIGQLSLALDELDIARTWLDRAVALTPDNPDAWGALAELGIAARDRATAEAALGRAMQLAPGDRTWRALVRRLP